ncbi:MAG: hypothetical protein ACOZNI_04930 [Myxococcota bacterium]
MDLKLTFLGRVANRWRVRVEVPEGLRLRGLTVGLWGEDGRPLGPAVVAPHGLGSAFEAELSGPCPLPAGAQVRCVADVEDIQPIEQSIGVDRRHGIHAFLHADQKLQLDPVPAGAAVTRAETRRLASVFPWMCRGAPAAEVEPAASDLRSMLKDLGVEDVDEELLRELED